MKMIKLSATIGIGLFFLILLASEAAGFEDTCERYPNGTYTDYWTMGSSNPTDSVSVVHNNAYNTNVLELLVNHPPYQGTYDVYIQSNGYMPDLSYLSFVTRATSSNGKIQISYYNSSTSALISTIELTGVKIKSDTKYELIWDQNEIKVYINGTLDQTASVAKQYNVIVKINLHALQPTEQYIQIDDITTTSTIGVPELLYESSDNLQFTWSSELMRSYNTPYEISLYSLSNANNAGKLKTWDLVGELNQSTVPEFGSISESRSSLLGNYYGLYLLEMTRGSDILIDQYFYYDDLANPQGFPEILFLGESSVNAEIRDEDMNGGEVEGGGTAYLYPDINGNGDYTFDYDILELPYAINTEFSTAYNTTAINSTTLSYSGLSGMNYNITVDGAAVGQTGGSDTFSHMFYGPSVTNNHVIAFSPDYSVTGVWGTIKDSTTQLGIKSATVLVTGNNISKTLYTDDNGLFYLTDDISAGQTYTVSVTKAGYDAPPSQTATTVEGSTTRSDFYMDKKESLGTGSGLYYAAHYVAIRVVKNEAVQSNITIMAYENGNTTATSSNITGYNGVCGFAMVQNAPYKLEFYESDGTTLISSVTLYPTGDYYTFDPWGIASGKAVVTSYSTKWLSTTFGYNSDTKAAALYYNVTSGNAESANFTIYKDGQAIYTSTSSANTHTFNTTLDSSSNYNVVFTIKNSDGRTHNATFPVVLSHQLPTGYSPFGADYPQWLKNCMVVGFAIVCLCFVGGAFSFYGLVMALLTIIGGWYMGILQFEGQVNTSVIITIIGLAATAAFFKYKKISGE